jgi:hypothetical protein
VFAVPRSMARSEEIRLKTDLKFMKQLCAEWKETLRVT